jgi:WS/DGAT/MGAT family acyltransferase
MKQLGTQDAQFLHADTEGSFANVATILIYGPPRERNGRLDAQSLIEHLRARLHTSPIFKRRVKRVPLDLDHPYWVRDEHFDVEYHVQYSALPKPGSWRQFTRFVSQYHNKPMDMSRPLWEVCMLDGLNGIAGIPKGSFALILKGHHAAIDGATGMQFVAGLSDIDTAGTPAMKVTDETQSASAEPAPGVMVIRALLNNVQASVRLLDSLQRAAPALWPRLLKLLTRGTDYLSFAVPDTRFNRPISPRRRFDACWFDLKDFKRIRESVVGATINDVVLAVCGGALRKYLTKHKELPQESLVAWVPINARPRDGESAGTAGNRLAAMTVPLYTDLAEPGERLQAISRQTHRLKEAQSATPVNLLMELSQHIPAYALRPFTRLIMRANLFKRMCNLMITNVPGLQRPLYIKGSQCLHQLGLTPIGDGMGLCIGTPSYNGEIVFIVMSTPEIIPDLEYFMHCLTSSFSELHQAA